MRLQRVPEYIVQSFVEIIGLYRIAPWPDQHAFLKPSVLSNREYRSRFRFHGCITRLQPGWNPSLKSTIRRNARQIQDDGRDIKEADRLRVLRRGGQILGAPYDQRCVQCLFPKPVRVSHRSVFIKQFTVIAEDYDDGILQSFPGAEVF